jgi:hypothetical protein
MNILNLVKLVYADDAVIPTYSGTGWNFTFSSVGDIFGRLLQYILPLAGIVLLFMLILGGIGLMTAAGDPKKMEASQGRITMALVGFLVIFISYFIVQLVGVMLGVDLLVGDDGNSTPYSENDLPTCNGGNGYVMCRNNRINYCNTSTGSWIPGDNCSSGTSCNDTETECVLIEVDDESCVNGNSKCEDGVVSTCYDNEWSTERCLSGECNDEGIDCKENEVKKITCTRGGVTREVGKNICYLVGLTSRLDVCGSDGQFTPSTPCTNGCVNTVDTAECKNADGTLGMKKSTLLEKYYL